MAKRVESGNKYKSSNRSYSVIVDFLVTYTLLPVGRLDAFGCQCRFDDIGDDHLNALHVVSQLSAAAVGSHSTEDPPPPPIPYDPAADLKNRLEDLYRRVYAAKLKLRDDVFLSFLAMWPIPGDIVGVTVGNSKSAAGYAKFADVLAAYQQQMLGFIEEEMRIRNTIFMPEITIVGTPGTIFLPEILIVGQKRDAASSSGGGSTSTSKTTKETKSTGTTTTSTTTTTTTSSVDTSGSTDRSKSSDCTTIQKDSVTTLTICPKENLPSPDDSPGADGKATKIRRVEEWAKAVGLQPHDSETPSSERAKDERLTQIGKWVQAVHLYIANGGTDPVDDTGIAGRKQEIMKWAKAAGLSTTGSDRDDWGYLEGKLGWGIRYANRR